MTLGDHGDSMMTMVVISQRIQTRLNQNDGRRHFDQAILWPRSIAARQLIIIIRQSPTVRTKKPSRLGAGA
jgi:hypothetical protein